MKTLITTLFMLCSLKCLSQNIPLHLNDKALHFSYSALATTSAIGYLHYQGVDKKKATVAGILIGVGVGVAKELVDKRWSNKDMKYNLMGVAAGAVVINIPLSRRKK